MKTNLKITMATLLITLVAFTTPVFAADNTINYSNNKGNINTNVDSNNTTNYNYTNVVNNISVTNNTNNYYDTTGASANKPNSNSSNPNLVVGLFKIQDGTSIENQSALF